jgi:3-keto-disaccharide hydrolase
MSSAVILCRSSLCAAVVFSLAASAAAQAPPPARVPGQMPDPSKEPVVVTPATTSGGAPSDAIVLFDGKDLSRWVTQKDGTTPAAWDIVDGAMQVKPKAGGIQSKDAFGSVQLHIEFATPTVVKGTGQGRGNSGVFLMNTYEIQVLDSYENKTYFHGQAGSIYKPHKPLVNPIRKPGEWNVYEIVFHAPKFDEDGKLLKRATFTAFLNGVLVQDHVEVMGVTSHDRPPYYEKHAEKLPIGLQDHGDLVRFRNIWVRPLD